MVHVSFTTSDYRIGRLPNPPVSEKQEALISLLDTGFFFFLYIHIRLDGDDQQLLVTLFKTEEKDRIQLESRKLALERDSGTLPDAEAWGEQTFPSS